ncbi:uncharacterized protein E0L32_012094 [Thyridium curvatum]|uniref:Uncharacterized protein n=1 Tax=Thyridium curvatum TaxID=1093900 RepID=A0A507BFR6_9PEZI|nr:uncharacterized protein E0L32_012094 [Thyridium curvatum]TPX17614.1 hypothetical protein E0L32_012094 [Thyridium curvatum]
MARYINSGALLSQQQQQQQQTRPVLVVVPSSCSSSSSSAQGVVGPAAHPVLRLRRVQLRGAAGAARGEVPEARRAGRLDRRRGAAGEADGQGPQDVAGGLRGPAPIQHALLRGDAHAGLTLQTLDHAAFDHGRILAQTRHPVPDGGCTTTARLTAHLAPLAADLLLASLRAGLHVPPPPPPSPVRPQQTDGGATHTAAATAAATGAPLLLQAAPKITKADLQVPWTSIAATGAGADAEAIARRERALGPLWTRAAVRAKKQKKNKKKDKHAGGQASEEEEESTKRLILEGLEAADLPPAGPLRSLFFFEGGGAPPPVVVDDNSGVQAVTFLQEGAAGGEQTAVALPVVKDGADDSLLVPLAVPVRDGRVAELAGGECLRIKAIRVEGDKTKPAAKAIEAFIEDVKSLRSRGRELAMDLVTREVK